MTPIELEKIILKEAKGLPDEALREIVDFIQFIKQKMALKGKAKYPDNLHKELSYMEHSELSHLEEEMQDYKTLYPREK